MESQLIIQYKLSENYSISYVDEEVLLLPKNEYNNESENKAILLNKTSTELLNLLQEPKKISELVSYIQSKYEVDTQRVSEDICKFINNMMRLSIITEIKLT